MRQSLLIIALVFVTSLVVAQDYSKSFTIEEMQVFELDTTSGKFCMVQDWIPYQAQAIFKDKMFYLGGKDDSVEGLHNWASFIQKIAPFEVVHVNYTRETSAWVVPNSDMECLVDIKYYTDGIITLDHVLSKYIFRYKLTLN